MIGLNIVLASIVTILVIASMIFFRNKALVFDWERGLKIYIEDIVYEEDDADEMQ